MAATRAEIIIPSYLFEPWPVVITTVPPKKIFVYILKLDFIFIVFFFLGG